jgi:DNA-directed RNA polymerase-3 subunit RPC5
LIEDENDGSGSLKDFREKMWAMAREENEDPWVSYKWKAGVSQVVAAIRGPL